MDSIYNHEPQADYSARGASAAREILQRSDFSARDLALCSSEEARSFIPCGDALALRVLPLALIPGPGRMSLHLAVDDDSSEAESALRFASGIDVTLTKVPTRPLSDAIAIAYLGSDARLEKHLRRLSDDSSIQVRYAHETHPAPTGDSARFITALLEFAAIRGASDLHLVPSDNGVIIKLRVDGELLVHDERPYALSFHEQVVSRLKVLASLDIATKLIPQDGSFSFPVGHSIRHARISTLPVARGESVVVRLLASRAIPQVSALGMEPAALLAVRGAMERTEGLILLTGPTGSGKSTTMYSIVSELDRRGRNVVTVEDPVEVPLPGMVQVQVSLQQGLDYPRAIRSVLRHDPDVLLIGEMRDGMSASIALDAASTGHLTISSLHAGSAAQAVRRLEVLGVPRARSVPALSLVINQRLLPKLCENCKISESGGTPSRGARCYRPDGCEACQGSGFIGRVLVTEVLDLQSRLAKEACYEARDPEGLINMIPAEAFIPWTFSLEYHLSRGDISAAQVDQFVNREFE